MKLDVCIKKFLRDFVLDVEFGVRDEVLAFLGASGAGKSMTLKIIAGIENPDEGRIVLNGRTFFDSSRRINLPPQARRVGCLFPNCALFPNMTVAENILFAASGTVSEKNFKLRENLTRFKLNGLENSYPHELSGGQAQCVARRTFAFGRTFQRAGHRMADRVAVINASKLEVVGFKHEIFLRPPTIAAALLTGCQNISAAKKIADDEIFAEDWRLTLSAKKFPMT